MSTGALPRISVVTSSYNQGQFIGRTIESVLAQDYPALEHILVDGMSKDDTPDVLARYPHLVVVREPDNGQADAINKGFRRATGDILCFLNSDDTFEPGALHRVAAEIDPARGRHVVIGRCRFIDEHDRFLGVEHPSAFEDHARVLAIWKGHNLPQPAIFWTREVWERCGPLDEREQLMLDYDLFCRFSRLYAFHPFDQVVANYRLHSASKTESVDDAKRLEDAIRVSRRYWPAPWTASGLALRASYWRFRLDRRGRAYRLMQAGREQWRQSALAPGAARIVAGAVLGPDVALNAAAQPLARGSGRMARTVAAVLRPRSGRAASRSPQTAAWRDFTDLHADGWAGPRLMLAIDVASAGATVSLTGDLPTIAGQATSLRAQLGKSVTETTVRPGERFELRVPAASVGPGRHVLHVESTAAFVPHDLWGNGDHRLLAVRISGLRVEQEDAR
jgi:glycosyltransferase involved in cell wall biosynthesis